MTYELWIVEGETPKPAGLFPGSDDPLLVALDGTVEPGNTIAVTIEDAGGEQVPQSNPIITSEPA